METGFFDEDTPHGRVKRIMYKKYLQAFIPVTQQAKTRDGEPFTTFIVDGFAGTGRYGNEWPTEIEGYGSPLIALMVSLNFFYRKKHGKDIIWGKERDTDADIADMVARMTLDEDQRPLVNPKVHLYFIESDDRYFNSLQENIAEVLQDFFLNPDISYIENETEVLTKEKKSVRSYQFSITHPLYPIVCNLINAEFDKILPPYEISYTLTKCLVFLDPFGYSQIPMSHVKKYVRPGNSLLINFMSGYVNRFLRDSSSTVLLELYGADYLGWKNQEYHDYLYTLFIGEGRMSKPLSNAQSCADNYEESLRRALKTEYSLTFEMRRKNNSVVYHLIFVTDHKKSLEIMKESMNCCSQKESGFSMSDYDFYRNGCILNLANTQDVCGVADAIYKKFECYSLVKISQVKDYVLLDTPYVFRKKPLAIMEKEEQPRLTDVFCDDGTRRKRKRTYPVGKDWLLKFRPSKETLELAFGIYENHTKGEPIPLSRIKTCYRFVDELHNALLLMATEKEPRRTAIYYAVNEENVPELKDIFNNHREWYIVFLLGMQFTPYRCTMPSGQRLKKVIFPSF